MKKARDDDRDTDMREEYDFTGGVRGKYVGRLSEKSIMVVLDPDVSEVFPDSTAVNDALRALAQIISDRSKRKTS